MFCCCCASGLGSEERLSGMVGRAAVSAFLVVGNEIGAGDCDKRRFDGE